MGFDINTTIPALTVFIQGVLSFLSPCVLPIIPLYIGYLSGGTITTDENGVQKYNQKKVLVNTLFFIIGVSFAFFLLGIGFSAVGKFFNSKQMLFSRIGGIIIILLGLIQLGIFDKPFKGREFKLPIKIDVLKMNPLTAFVMGFTFSFAWTPCVGPALSTVLIMISSANSTLSGLLLMGVYTLGFTLPFLLVGIFTTQFLNLFKKYRKVMAYTVKVGGILMVLMGAMMFTGVMNGITGYMSTISSNPQTNEYNQNKDNNSDTNSDNKQNANSEDESQSNEDNKNNAEGDDEREIIPAINFDLKDQYGNTHKLSDYKGKVIFLNFWATWCPPCKEELPDIQKLYEKYGLNKNDVVVLGVASPKSDKNQYTQEGDEQHVKSFLKENNYTFPVLMDDSGLLQNEYSISSYPTTYMIDANGNIYGYVSGMITYDIMESIVKETMENK